MKKAIVISGGNINEYNVIKDYISDYDLIICADSGVLHCDKLGLKPHVVAGDFDSSHFSEVKNLSCTKNAKIIKLNPEKDNTDTEFAMDYAASQGCKQIFLVAGTGTRLDHTLANFFLMEKYNDMGIEVTIFNERNIIHFVKNSTLSVYKNKMKYISILPFENVIVTNNGFKYPLNNELLRRNSSRGVSNELVEPHGSFAVKNGSALIIESKD